MRPHIICHMLSTVDGRIDPEALRSVQPGTAYEEAGAQLGGDAWLCGRTTMQQHFAKEGVFQAKDPKRAGKPEVHVAQRSESYAVGVDTHGKLLWECGDLDGDHLICVLSEQVSEEYLSYLRSLNISYIVAGSNEVDLQAAVETLAKEFGISTLLLEGGGMINGAMLAAGLVDEVSLLLAPGVDGSLSSPSVFDGRLTQHQPAVQLQLRSVKQLNAGVLWIRYDLAAEGQHSQE